MNSDVEVRGPMNAGACCGAPCGVCHRAVRGIVYFVEYVRWTTGTRHSRNGISFFYYHASCYRGKVAA